MKTALLWIAAIALYTLFVCAVGAVLACISACYPEKRGSERDSEPR